MPKKEPLKIDPATLNQPPDSGVFSENALRVLTRRYFLKDDAGSILETPEQLFWRVASNVASVEAYNAADAQRWAKEFYRLMIHRKFIPNSPTLMNAGKAKLGQLSACFVLPVGDSMEEIFTAIMNTALIHKSGGGTGFSFSRLRPKNDPVASTKGVSSGPISFMTVFDAATEAVKQGGTRRGANMAMLSCDHPDILDFITCKDDSSKLNNFNISVAITSKFMSNLAKGSKHSLVNPRNGEVIDRIPANQIFDLIVEQAHKNGEPGVIFIDEIQKHSPTDGVIEATNPCGEQPLLPYESCNLGSINLAQFATIDGVVDWDGLAMTVQTAVRFLDNVISANVYPLKEIEEVTKKHRKIGLGVMGFADFLVKQSIPYNSEEGLAAAKKVMKFISNTADKQSEVLAEERGSYAKDISLRNATRTTIAPTGTISIIANCSSGIEPIFALSFTRNILDKNDRLLEVHPIFEDIAKREGFYSVELMERIAETGTIADEPEIPDEWKKVFVTAHEVDTEWHIRMQAEFQKFTDNAVSKTVNLEDSATTEDIRDAFLQAHTLKCKGITVYRDGSREEQVLQKGSAEPTKEIPLPAPDAPTTEAPTKRDKKVSGYTVRTTTGCGNLYITINSDQHGNLFEVFTAMGKAGGCASAQLEAITRLITLNLRSGGDPTKIVKHLHSISCQEHGWTEGGKNLSCADAIAKELLQAIGINEQEQLTTQLPNAGACPDCGAPLKPGKCRECPLGCISRCS